MLDLLDMPWVAISTRADLENASRVARRLVLTTPPGLVGGVGPGWFKGLIETVDIPVDMIPLNDCGSSAGFALASLNLGIGVTIPETHPDAQTRLASIGATLGLPVLFQRRPSLNLADVSVGVSE